MNTYNENLRTSVVISLQNQELALETIDSKMQAVTSSLYYAQGEKVNAEENLCLAKNDIELKALAKTQAVAASNITNNQLMSATQASVYNKQSVTNSSTGAANIQVASNAIVRLARDLGSIYSIVNAADFDSEIYTQALQARDLINTTAYEAELASQMAMEATMLTSAVSSGTVMAKSKSTNDSMTALLKVMSDNYSAASQAVADNNTVVAVATAKEKTAEGVYKDAMIEADATRKAYGITNDTLNLNLVVAPDPAFHDTKVNVHFDWIADPFAESKGKWIDPVQDYYLVFVKDSKKTTFTSGAAESIIQDISQPDAAGNGVKPLRRYVYISRDAASAVKATDTSVDIDPAFIYKDKAGNDYNLRDSDGDIIDTGIDYVVFVTAAYTDTYKRTLNNFSDFLSAPSAAFCLTLILHTVESKDIFIFEKAVLEKKITDAEAKDAEADNKTDKAKKTVKDQEAEEKEKRKKIAPFLGNNPEMTIPDLKACINDSDDRYLVIVKVGAKTDYKVNHRLMLLPFGARLNDSGQLNEDMIAEDKKTIADLIREAEAKNPGLLVMAKDIKKAADVLKVAENAFIAFNATKKDAANATGSKKPKSDEEQQKEDKLRLDLQNQQKASQKAFTDLQNEYNGKLASFNLYKSLPDMTGSTNRIGFIFNLALAENVMAGNYINLEPVTTTGNAGDNRIPEQFRFASIGSETADIFGNVLIPDIAYYPVVLACSGEPETEQPGYTSSLTDYKDKNTTAFEYNL